MNKVVHFEIPADNLDRAKKFYAETFGWNLQEIPDMGYVMVTTTPSDQNGQPTEPGGINGGMMQRSTDDGGEHPVVVINVPSVDEHIKKVTQAGGTIVKDKIAVADMGYYARFKDPEGNVLGLWKDKQ